MIIELDIDKELKKVMAYIKKNNALPKNYDEKQTMLDETFLCYCIQEDKIKEFELLLKMGARPNQLIYLNSGSPLLIEAARLGRIEHMKTLLDYGVNINVKNEDGWSAGWCTQSPETLLFLHNNGLNLADRDTMGNTILTKMMSVPLKQGSEEKWDTKMCAIIDANIFDVNALSLPRDSRQEKKSPLMFAIIRARLKVVQKLIEKGANIYYSDKGISVLSLAQEAASLKHFKNNTSIDVYEYIKSLIEKNSLEEKINVNFKAQEKSKVKDSENKNGESEAYKI